MGLFTHPAVIMSFRYVLEDLSVPAVLDIDREVHIPNGSLTRYRRSGDLFELDSVADTEHLETPSVSVTREPLEEQARADD